MSRLPFAPFFTLWGALALVSTGFAAAPELLDPVQPENGAPRVTPGVPFGKTLVLPIAASDADGDLLEFRATTSNPKVFAQLHTGNPILRVHVDYAGDSAAVPPSAPFSGELEFQLFRDLTPITSGTVAGLAQAGYYDNLIFHRIIPGFVAQGGDPAGNGSGLSDPTNPASYIGLPFSFDHEFRPSLIFSGRGQLAMANSNGGYERGRHVGSGFIQLGNFNPTNGSQFFVTFAQPRHLDFKHTIFGQLLRGFDLLDKLAAVPRDAGDKPTVPVKMTSVTVEPGRSDATLFVSATAVGRSSVTVFVRDPSGNETSRTFDVIVSEDTVNDPPVLRPLPNLVTPVGVAPNLPLTAFDLERDYQLFGIAAAGGATDANAFGQAGIVNNYNPRQTAGFQNLAVGVAGFNDPAAGAAPSAANPFAPFDPYSFQVAELGYGDRPIDGFSRDVTGTAGVALDHAIVAEFRDADAAGRPADFTAVVNWGDGTAERSSTTTPDPTVFIERSSERPGRLVVKANHTYAHPGNYLVRVIVDAPLGATAKMLSHAVISDPAATARIVGRDLEQSGPALHNRMVAQIEPAGAASLNETPAVIIDWGDGDVSPGVAKRSGNAFAIFGTHIYREPTTYAVQTFLLDPAAAATSTLFGESSVRVTGIPAGRRSPPFNMPHLVGQISAIPGKQFKTTTGTGTNTITRFACSIVIVNAGNENSREGKIRLYLSSDAHLNLTPITNPTGPPTPADIPLKIGSFPEGTIPALAPGGGLRFVFDVAESQDLRLVAPKGETGAGLFVLATLIYKDPVADHMPIDHDATFGPINGIIVSPQQLQVKEAAGSEHSASFTVRLDRPPTADVKIPLTVSDGTEIEIDKAELIFTAQNWSVAQTVIVSAKDDTTKESSKTSLVRLGASISTDLRWNGMDGDDVSVTVTDND